MLLIETPVDRITGILESDRPIALVPAESRDRAKEIAGAVSDGGFGVAVILDRSERLFVLVVGDVGHTAEHRPETVSAGTPDSSGKRKRKTVAA